MSINPPGLCRFADQTAKPVRASHLFTSPLALKYRLDLVAFKTKYEMSLLSKLDNKLFRWACECWDYVWRREEHGCLSAQGIEPPSE